MLLKCYLHALLLLFLKYMFSQQAGRCCHPWVSKQLPQNCPPNMYDISTKVLSHCIEMIGRERHMHTCCKVQHVRIAFGLDQLHHMLTKHKTEGLECFCTECLKISTEGAVCTYKFTSQPQEMYSSCYVSLPHFRVI